jgi:cytochrome o ubiquinol oxidase subunit 2
VAKQKNKNQTKPIWLTFLGLFGLGLFIAMLLRGTDVTLFNPKGLIAQEQHNLMVLSVALMLAIAVPALILLYYFAWKYRESNGKATYNPHVRHGRLLVLSLWAIPSAFILILAFVVLPAIHKLEPQKPIVADAESLTIQVVAMRWKWLFTYPEQNIATVNFVQVPIDTQVRFELSADEAPKSSFWIPHLGGQLYAMTGHVNPLYLMAEEPGDYPGSSAEINGAGFAGMKFIARASSKADFDLWVQDVQMSSNVLDATEYEKLLEASENNPAAFYSMAETDLYAKMLMKYAGSHDHRPAQYDTGHSGH